LLYDEPVHNLFNWSVAMRVLIADKFEAEGIDGLKALGCDVLVDPQLGPETLGAAMAAHGTEALIVRSTKTPAGVINGTNSLKIIIRAGAGYDNIDTVAASEAGVGVCNCPGMNADAVAELAIGLLVCADRRICEQTAAMKSGQWNKHEYGKSRGLKGRLLGVVGVGAIGQGVIERARAFGMEIGVWSRSMNEQRAAALGARSFGSDRSGLLRLARKADAVSVHVAATGDTSRLIDAAFFAEMRPGTIFLNTSRGSVVDEQALRMAVEEKGLRIGLDVYENQPSEKACNWTTPTASLEGVTLTHHCGASTDQAQLAVAEETVRIVAAFMETGAFRNLVNKPAHARA